MVNVSLYNIFRINRTLEDRFVLDTPAGELLAVHGSPRRINEYLFEASA